jgi:hypothetical protein
MLQILVWAICLLIMGVAYCAMQLVKLNAEENSKKGAGQGVFLILFVLALLIFALSVSQGIEISNILNK